MASGTDGLFPFKYKTATHAYSLGQWSAGVQSRTNFGITNPTTPTNYLAFSLMGFNTGNNSSMVSYVTPANSNVLRLYNRASSTISPTATLRLMFVPSSLIVG